MATARDMLVDLMVTVKADQEAAFQELNTYLQTAEAQNFRSTVSAIQSRTIPGGNQDQVLDGVLRVFDAMVGITQQEMQRIVANQAMADIQPDAPVVPDAPVIVVPTEALLPDAPVALDLNEPLPDDPALPESV